ncbi:MAG: PIN domain-containing protein [Anaerolineae bacterium]
MADHFLDTNLIIRYLTRDNPDQAARAYRIFQRLETGQLTAATCEGVIIEAVQVLSSKRLYNVPRQDIRMHLATIIQLRGLKLPNKRTYLRALDLYASTSLDFVDVLIVAHMERSRVHSVLSFDQDFSHIPGITRTEP